MEGWCDGTTGSTGRCNHGNTESHDERNDDPKLMGSWFIRQTAVAQSCDSDHGTGHVDVCTERYYEVADLLARRPSLHIPD